MPQGFVRGCATRGVWGARDRPGVEEDCTPKDLDAFCAAVDADTASHNAVVYGYVCVCFALFAGATVVWWTVLDHSRVKASDAEGGSASTG